MRFVLVLVALLTSFFAATVSQEAAAQALSAANQNSARTAPGNSAVSSAVQNMTNKKTMPLFSVNIGDSENPDDLVPALRVVGILTILTFAPAILLLTSAFTRIMIVLSFLRQALGSPTMPPNQVLVGLSLFLTYFVMAPTTTRIYDTAIVPYMEKQITASEAFERGQTPARDFMLSQARKEDMQLFFQLSKMPQPKTAADVPMRILIPAFVISELKAAFQIGFLVYLPFIIIDMIVSSVLMAMGMMMLPPTVVSLPLKIILFVVVDGWNLLAGSLIRSFGT